MKLKKENILYKERSKIIMFPISKYKFYITPDKTKTVAVSTYAGKKVKGIAKLHPNDVYDENFGKELAAARCNVKITKKRQKDVMKKLRQAYANMREAHKYLERMKEYQHEVDLAENEAVNTLVKLKYLS